MLALINSLNFDDFHCDYQEFLEERKEDGRGFLLNFKKFSNGESLITLIFWIQDPL